MPDFSSFKRDGFPGQVIILIKAGTLLTRRWSVSLLRPIQKGVDWNNIRLKEY
jgi:hypothetical protein